MLEWNSTVIIVIVVVVEEEVEMEVEVEVQVVVVAAVVPVVHAPLLVPDRFVRFVRLQKQTHSQQT